MKSEAAVVIGVDAHKRTHTLVAADELGLSSRARPWRRRQTGIWRRSRGRPGGRAGAGRWRTAGI